MARNTPINKAKQSTHNSGITRLQHSLGYQFTDRALLSRALTHKSHGKANNERLEFVGDAVLGYVVGAMLYTRKSELGEDMMSLMRAQLVRGATLADIARKLDLPALLLLGSGELKSGGRERNSILADAMEAVIGAVHEDGGIEASRRVIIKLFDELLEALDPATLKDAKTRLQEWIQGEKMPLPTYEVSRVAGADHARRYTVTCRLDGLELCSEATASSRRQAEKDAAFEMLNLLAARNSEDE